MTYNHNNAYYKMFFMILKHVPMTWIHHCWKGVASCMDLYPNTCSLNESFPSPLTSTGIFCPGHPIDAHPRLVQLQGEAARRFLFAAETTAAGLCQQDTEAVPQVGDVGEVDAQWKVQVKPRMAIGGLVLPPFKKNMVDLKCWYETKVRFIKLMRRSTREFGI